MRKCWTRILCWKYKGGHVLEAFSFPCDCCGLCCQHLDADPLYRDLDRGDGVCHHYDSRTHLCKIYDHRPQKCNVAAAYNWFRGQMTYEEYIQTNIKACQKLKEEYLCHCHS